MPAKASAKKRKAPEANSSNLDSYNIAQSGRSKCVTLSKPQITSPPLSATSSSWHTENENPSMIISSNNNNVGATTLLGRFRRRGLFDKIQVQQFQAQQGSPSETQFEDTWTKLEELVEAILNRTPVKTNFQVAYELGQSVCLYGKKKVLYIKLESALAKHIQLQKDAIISAMGDDVLLATLDNIWKQFCDHLVSLEQRKGYELLMFFFIIRFQGTIRSIFIELERRYIIPDTAYVSLLQLGKHMFKQNIMESSQIQQKTIERTMHLIQGDRDGMMVDLKMVRSITQMLLDLSLYTSHFEPYFIKSTTEYYTVESANKLQDLSIHDYIHCARHRIEQESENRINTYLDKSTKEHLTTLVVKLYIHDKLDTILSQGFEILMDQEDTITLNILYCFLPPHQTHLITKLRVAFMDYIKNHGVHLIKDPANDSTMVLTLLQYKDKLNQILKMAFNDNPSFSNALKESFENFLNSRDNKPAEMLAKFIDSTLRFGTKQQQQQQQQQQQAEQNLEELLNKVLVIFRYIQGKDVFEAFYKRFLSKRLLLSRTVSNDLEKGVLSKIKAECGPDFTKNLENMFKDMEISADLNLAFKASKEYSEEENIPISVNVLGQGVWPTHPTTDIILPTNMASLLDAYQLFYISKFNGRKLTWRNALGTCILKAHFPLARKELAVSLFQAIVLMLFNDKSKPKMGYKDIAHATDLDDKELRRVLQSLSCGKYIILNKYPKINQINDDDIFEYNDKFTASARRLKITIIQQEQYVEEQKEIQSKVLVDRHYQLEAAIVRIMKSQKSMTHKDLVSELFKQLKFPVNAPDIKDRIESLIDRDYLTRAATDNSLYLYQS
ncbi:ubiquitin-protein ligase, cullin 4 [Absidia repens]|uniref:Ubiquitin-protein ligase, cullin 4 n=1 Tax=Absidia repens TaxID=90262 RepID=A0A1X2IW80_9FUNG|nr:ubiquitin-protein ligase, cullin 4 [Absidia repens]